MFNLCKFIWNYGRLCFKLNKLYNEYMVHKTINTPQCHLLIDTIQDNILMCGAICIKFAQWLLPILDNIYIKESDKPYWFLSLENLYENCPTHSKQYSKEIYNEEFNEIFDNDYKIVNIIGSGSIGQVYKIQNIHTDRYFAYKCIHPDVKQDLLSFKCLLKVCLWFSCIRNKLYSIVPVNYLQFVDNFQEQIDMRNEGNNLLRTYYNYNDNKAIIIPQLIKCTESCMIMTYEEGTIMDKMDISNYQKTKIISLLYGFISSNQLFDDIMHNDIHKANWKVKCLPDNKYSLIIYDFGYCYKKKLKDRPIIHLMTDLCESADESTDNSDKCIQMMQFFIDDYSEETKQDMIKIIPKIFKADPNHILDIILNVCNVSNKVVDASAFQILITSIQTFKYFKDAGINNGNNLKNDGYRMYRERYLDLCNLYKTYDCFYPFVDYMSSKLNRLNIPVTQLFDVIDDNETISSELHKLLKFKI